VKGKSFAIYALIVLCVINLLNYVDRYAISSVLKEIGEAFTVDSEALGFANSVFLFSFMIFAPIISLIVDGLKIKRKWIIAPGIIIWSLATALGGFAESYTQLIITRAFIGIGEASYVATAAGIISDIFPRKWRNIVLMFFYLFIPVGAGLGFILGGVISDIFDSWRYSFYIVGFPGIIFAILALTIKEPPRGNSEEGISSEQLTNYLKQHVRAIDFINIFKIKSWVFGTLGMAMMTFAMGGLGFWIATFTRYKFGLHAEEAGFLTGIIAIVAGITGTVTGAIIGEFWQKRNSRGYFLISGITMLMGFPLTVFCIYTNNLTVLIASLFIAQFFIFFSTAPGNVIILNVTPPKIRVAAFAINVLIIHLIGDAFSPPLMGHISGKTINESGMIIASFAMIISGLVYLFGSRYYADDITNMKKTMIDIN